MKITLIILSSVLLVIVVSQIFGSLDTNRSTTPSLSFGSTPALSVLPIITKYQGIYPEQILSVRYHKFQTGKSVMDALISGDIEVGTLVDVNVSYLNFTVNPIRIIASLGDRLADSIYFKKELGINAPKDLIAKKIGYVPASTSHIFLARFLEVNNINWQDIKPIALQPAGMEAALKNNFVDAVSIWQPWGNNIEKSLGDNIGVFFNKLDIYPSKILLATTENVIQEKPLELQKLVLGLAKASEFYSNYPESTYPYLSSEIRVSIDDVKKVLEKYTFQAKRGSVALSLISQIGVWIRKSQANFQTQPLPDYQNVVDDRFMQLEIESIQE